MLLWPVSSTLCSDPNSSTGFQRAAAALATAPGEIEGVCVCARDCVCVLCGCARAWSALLLTTIEQLLETETMHSAAIPTHLQGLRGHQHLRASPPQVHLQGVRGRRHLREQPRAAPLPRLRGREHVCPQLSQLGILQLNRSCRTADTVARNSLRVSDFREGREGAAD